MKKICASGIYVFMALCINPLSHAMQSKKLEPQKLTGGFSVEWQPTNFINTDTSIKFIFIAHSLSVQNPLGIVSGIHLIANYNISLVKSGSNYTINVLLNGNSISATHELKPYQFTLISNQIEFLMSTNPTSSKYVTNITEKTSDMKNLYNALASLVNTIFVKDPAIVITPLSSKPNIIKKQQQMAVEEHALKSISDQPETSKKMVEGPIPRVINTPVVEPIVPVEPENIYIPIELVEPTQHSIIPTKIQPLQAEGHASKSISDQPKFPKLSTLKGQKETVPTSYEENPTIVLPNVPVETESEEYMHRPIELALPSLTISEPSYTTRIVAPKQRAEIIAAPQRLPVVASKIKEPEILKNETLERYQGIARERGEQKTGRSFYTSLAKYVGAGALTGTVVGALAGAKKLEAPVVGGTWGLLYGLRQEYLAASPGWKAQMEKLNPDNISDRTVSISGKTYLLAKGFDAIEAAGYSPHVRMSGDGKHYEIYLMPSDTHLVDFFLDITNFLNTVPDLKKTIAFVALRPTPRIYDTNAITSVFSRQVLPRIIICFRKGAFKISQPSILKNMIQWINRFITNKTQYIVQPSGYPPRYSEEITNIIYIGFGSGDYKKLHPNEFKRHTKTTWYGRTVSEDNDMAYPEDMEELKMTVPQ